MSRDDAGGVAAGLPGPSDSVPPIPVRMLNEFVYCPRLAWLEWVAGEWADSADTVDGRFRHRRIDRPGSELPAAPEEHATIHARSVTLGSETLGIVGRLDLVEGDGVRVTPVDYKRGKRPHIEGGAWQPERVQLCAQGLLLREHGYAVGSGVLYFAASRERVPVEFDDALVVETHAAIAGLRALAQGATPPDPLSDSPKCPRCSLVGICQPDEIAFLRRQAGTVRPLYVADSHALPLHVQSPRAYLRKEGDCIVVEADREKIAEARLADVSQVVVYGGGGMTTPLLHELMGRNIPVTWLSYGGWLMGHTVGAGHHNVDVRTDQYRASFDAGKCLALARGLVAAKIRNCRTLLRRNWRGEGAEAPAELLIALKEDAQHAERAVFLESLLGIEGSAAARYFVNFGSMLKADALGAFAFSERNRRPPRDPVNALLSFAYSMLSREWLTVLSAVGLDAYRGFYHQPRFARPALALDLMEPFRPLVADSSVITAINNGEVGAADFVHAAGGCALTDRGRRAFIAAFERRMATEITHPLFGNTVSYRRLLEVQARLLIRWLAGEIPDYPNFITR
ncbi:MAG: CRISPR-associated exonuclease Cas4/endonuclease Cas1 fusion [Rhodocyclaceae bacterium]|nr:MAG: CRISPR-associated endonuclease Cas1 [Rhodocyclaceae bacterium]MBV6408289.1 CRISPR-associated exonuclease Cas4/endonuclease Cas1 fusion [Rhodocyclaceae bacterium]CAG0934877.1 CRISPR-associated exonuclease Cas4/endonuclease Cas1 fusion [Rhodocyclaceae bacterium]